MTDHDALLAAVLADPADDTPRLVLADWLEEHGQPERAEFIRLQVEIFRNDYPVDHDCGRAAPRVWEYDPLADCRRCRGMHRMAGLHRRERELLEPNWRPWAGVPATYCLNYAGSGAVGVAFRRGFVDDVRLTLAAFAGGACGNCDGTGQLIDADGPCPDCGGQFEPRDDWTDRGWSPGTGRILGVAPALFAAHPVQEIVLTNAGVRLSISPPGEGYGWQFYVYPTSQNEDGYLHMDGGMASRNELIQRIVNYASGLSVAD